MIVQATLVVLNILFVALAFGDDLVFAGELGGGLPERLFARDLAAARLGEDNIGASSTRRADFAGLRDIRPPTAGFGLVYARPLRQSWPEEPVIRWMPA